MKQYESYKPSGTPWIGDIPSHWEVKKLKYLLNIFGRIGFRGYTNQDIVGPGEGAVTLSPSNIIDGKMDYSKCTYLSWDKYYESPEIMVENGDVIFVKTASVGKSALIENLPEKTTLNPQIVVFKNIDVNNRLLAYLLQTPIIDAQVRLSTGGSTILTISQESIGNYTIPVPFPNEQEAIAVYLDRKCESIDKVIATQERRIALLSELKQSIITEAVTRGLNPDAPLKDSGIDWIGKIPEHWEVIPLKYTGRFSNGLTYSPEDVCEDTGILVLRSSNIQDDTLDYSDTVYVKSCPEILRTRPGDIIICSRNGSASLVGKCAMVKDDINATFGAFMMRYRPYTDSIFGFYLLQAALKMYKGFYSTTTINQLTMGVIAQIHVALPSKDEQVKIANYLDKTCSRIDSAIVKAKREIELLREFKQSVITEAVTGKIKVC